MGAKRTIRWCHDKKDVPAEPHYAIVEFSQIYVPAQGHGYPAGTESKCDYIAFTDEEEWKTEISKRAMSTYDRNKFVAFKVGKPVGIRTQIVVEEGNNE